MSFILSFLFPWLLIVCLLQVLARRPGNWRSLLAFALAALVIVLLPARGIPLGRWMAGLNYQPSIPFLGSLAALVWKNCFRSEILRPEDKSIGWIFGGVVGTLLYPLALGLGNFDCYSWGWGFSALFPILAVITIGLIWRRNRFGVLLLLSIVAYDLHWLESPNFWDYLVDPIYWLLSLSMLANAALKKLRGDKLLQPQERESSHESMRP